LKSLNRFMFSVKHFFRRIASEKNVTERVAVRGAGHQNSFSLSSRVRIVEPRESGKPGFGFALFLGVSELFGMWKSQRDFQGRWEGWKT
jgi:hypothetical protein